MEIAVKINNLSKDFPVGDSQLRVLHNLSLEIFMGQLTMLVGPSGCGKTTLISIISGILSATEGNVEMLGKNLMHMNDKEKVLFRREHVGFIFQQYNLLPALTAAENAALPLIAASMPIDKAIEQANVILAQIGMAEHCQKYPRQLSGGQQQRVAIARALVHQPQLIVCDEPTAALDAKSGQAVMDILRTIANDQKRAVIIVTHDNRIYHFADRIIEMSDGQIIGEHHPEEYLQKET